MKSRDGVLKGATEQFRTSALAHVHVWRAPAHGFLLVSLHRPITINRNSTAHIACICTVHRVILIAYTRWVLGTEFLP
jgi:hypothetical protein